jgi:hypothetical protein
MALYAGTVRGANRDIPEDYLAYPVHINMPNAGDASGFYISNSSHVYLVTARHVFFNIPPTVTTLPVSLPLRTTDVELISSPRVPGDTGKNRVLLDVSILFKSGRVALADDHDVMIVQILRMGNPPDRVFPFEGVRLGETSGSGIMGTPIADTREFNDVLTGNEIFMFGYPSSIGLKQVPQIEYDKPLVKKGIVAGKNVKRKTIILDCAVYPGNSGGPVLQVEHDARTIPVSVIFHPIGVVSEFVPFVEMWHNDKFDYSNTTVTNSGYAVMESMDAVLKLIDRMEGKISN